MADSDTPAGAASLQTRFVHLHLHSQYSLLDGGNRLDRLVARCKELGMDAVAVTDHGNLFGAADFYNKAKDAGIKAILGIEAYVAPNDRTDRTHTGVADGGYHLVLLAENQTGWQHLLKLSSDAYINGFYYRPRMDKSTLAQWADGLIAINGHLGSSLAAMLLRYEQTGDEAHYQQALAEAKWHAETFTPNENGEPRFFIELQRHSVQEQIAINKHLIRLARELDLPLVCDNDAHFLLEEDWDMHDTLCCISMGKVKTEPNRLRYPKDLYVKSPEQMIEAFEDLPEAVENTVRIAERCNAKVDFGANHAPVVKIVYHGPGTPADGFLPTDSDEAAKVIGSFRCKEPLGSTAWFKAFCSQFELLPFDSQNDTASAEDLKRQCDGALRLLTEAGAIWRYGPEGITETIRARMERELKVLADKLISAYFLIVWDFVADARKRDIPSNARGSGVGTMVGYCLGLSNACPVQYGLLFERFTDPDRSEYPDIDIDICQDGRQSVIEYVRKKYGHVAQIITFNVLKAKAAVRDVGRVMDLPLPEVDKLCKLIGDGLGTTLESALAQEPELRQTCSDNPNHAAVIETARKLEGMARHVGVHAAGVIIGTQPLDNIVPLYQPSGTDTVVTQWDGPTCEKVGLLKMDFLGLRTLSIIERCKQLIRSTMDDKTVRATVGAKRTDPDPLDLERLRFDDQQVLDLFRRGETAGVFQFESGGMRNLLMAMKPDRLEDLIAANALYRPGPMELIPTYVDRKHGRAPVPPVHPIVDQFTAETYGIMVYQEQVMQIVHGLGEIPLRVAYNLIKAISKKKQKDIDKVRPKFVEGAQKQGLSEKGAEELFELIMKFAGYGFNKSHSTGYAIVAYQTAYLKTYFPVQYMAALLTYEAVSTEKVVEYIDECKRVRKPDGSRGVAVGAPDINLSYTDFTVVYDKDEPHEAHRGHIRFGLGAVKGVGEKAVEAIITARKPGGASGGDTAQAGGPFSSLYDFCERVPLGAVNRATIEALIKCGAFDSVHSTAERPAMIAALDAAMQAGHRVADDRDSGQLSFFEAFEAAESESPSAATKSVALPHVDPWTPGELLKAEKSVLGFYISSHPMDAHRAALATFSNVTVEQARTLGQDVAVILGGILTRVKITVTRAKQEKMAILTLEDASGPIDVTVFPRTYAVVAPLLQTDRIVIIKGKVDRKREDPSILADDVVPIEQAAATLTTAVTITLHGELVQQGPGPLPRLEELLRQQARAANGHAADVYFEVYQDGQVATLHARGLRIGVSEDLPERIATVLNIPESAPQLRSSCCRLSGPRKLIATREMLHQDDPTATGRATFRSSQIAEGEFCDSIDRY